MQQCNGATEREKERERTRVRGATVQQCNGASERERKRERERERERERGATVQQPKTEYKINKIRDDYWPFLPSLLPSIMNL